MPTPSHNSPHPTSNPDQPPVPNHNHVNHIPSSNSAPHPAPTAWAKAHKKSFTLDYLRYSGATPESSPSCVFMAGLPGAGKTELVTRLFQGLDYGIVRIDMDEIATRIPAYRPEAADRFREAATLLLSNIFSLTLKNRFSFVMDGTFGSKRALENIQRAIRHDYRYVKVVYVHQAPEVAWNFTQAREQVEHRSISLDGFIKTYFNLASNLQQLAALSPQVTIDVIVKDGKNGIGEWQENVTAKYLDEKLKTSYNKTSLKEKLYENSAQLNH